MSSLNSKQSSLSKDLRLAWFLYSKMDRGGRSSAERLRSGMVLLVLSLAFGVAALVSLDVFTRRIEASVGRDSKALLAADYQVHSWRPFDATVWDGVREEKSRGDIIEQDDFVSSIPLSDGAATVTVRALEGDHYPYYGTFETRPKLRIEDLRSEPRILLDSSFEARGVQVGQKVRLGAVEFTVAAFIVQEPETVASAFAMGPRVIIHRAWEQATGLSGRGARVHRYLLIKSPLKTEDFIKKFRARAPEPHWRLITPEKANRQSERIVNRIRGFLSLVGLTGLFLGGMGLFMIFRSQFLLRLNQFLTLRCLGVQRRPLIYVAIFRALVVGLSGWAVGAICGYGFEELIVSYARRGMNVPLAESPIWPSVLYGGVLSLAVGLVASVAPLLEILRIPVSSVMRQDETQQLRFRWRDGVALALLSIALTLVVNRDLKLTAVFLGGLLGASLLLILLSSVLGALLLPLTYTKNFLFRHGLLSLLRKPARTQLLLVSLGIGLFLLESLVWIAVSLRQQLNVAQREGIPNVFFLNVAEADLPILRAKVPELETVPMTQGRLLELENQAITLTADDDEGKGERFFQTREYFVTRRSKIESGEHLVQGTTLFKEKPSDDTIRASIEEDFARSVKLKIGSTFKIDIAGVPMTARVDSLRSVDWFDFKPNFFIVFNEDDFKDAPVDYVGFARVDPSRVRAVQGQVGAVLPQVSVLDGESIGKRLTDLLNKLSFSVFSLSLFSLGSCVFVFVGMTLARVREYKKDIALWKCLGLEARRIRQLFVFESVTLVTAASLTSLLASALTSKAICYFALEIPLENPGAAFFAVSLLASPVLFGGLVAGLGTRFVSMNSAQIWRELES